MRGKLQFSKEETSKSGIAGERHLILTEDVSHHLHYEDFEGINPS